LYISSIALSGTNASSFLFSNTCGSSLAAGANCAIHGHFTPTTGGALTAAMTIADNVTGSPQKISLSGTGNTTVTLSAPSITFAGQLVGTTSASQTVTLTNTGSATLYIASIAVSGTNASSFQFSNSCGTSIAAGASCTIHGHFAPATTGTLTAAINIVDNVNASPQVISLTGTGFGDTTVSLSATSLSFGSQAVGTTSASQSVTLTNTGSATLYFTSITVTGANATSFVFSNTCGASVAAGGSCSIHGHFTPAATGPLTAAVKISDNVVGAPQTISLTGTGH
jgi:hypothetical protein